MNWEDAESNAQVQMHLSNYWEYSSDDEGLDWSYVDRFQLFVYDELEECSYHTARMILAHSPSAVVAFTNPTAAFFLTKSERVLVAGTEEDLFETRGELRDLRTLRVHSPRSGGTCRTCS